MGPLRLVFTKAQDFGSQLNFGSSVQIEMICNDQPMRRSSRFIRDSSFGRIRFAFYWIKTWINNICWWCNSISHYLRKNKRSFIQFSHIRNHISTFLLITTILILSSLWTPSSSLPPLIIYNTRLYWLWDRWTICVSVRINSFLSLWTQLLFFL